MFNLIKKYFSFLFLFTQITFSQTKLDVAFDYCIFKSDDNNAILELYFSFDQTQLTFIKSDSGFSAAGQLILDVYDVNTQELNIAKNYRIPLNLSDTSLQKRKAKLVGQLNLILDTGKYKISLIAMDYYSPLDSVRHEETFTVTPFPTDKVISSSLQIAGKIYKSKDVNSIFYKNTLEVEPNPIRLFGNNLSKIYYYVELYNLKPDYLTDDYSVIFTITDLNDIVIKTLTNSYKLKGESKVEWGQVEISELVTGKYKLKMKLEDSKLNKKLELEKTFYVINTDTSRKTLSDDAGFLASEYMNYTEEQISDEYDKMVYLMNENSIENFGKLNSTELRRKFLYGFWKNLDPVPYTQLNEFKTEYFSRIVYSNKNFKSELLPGWKTDRGRVYCLYGSPAEIERYPFEATSRAYEIWRYTNVEGGVEFIFIELGSDAGDYTLVHSTKKGEFSDSEWKRRLKVR